MKKIVLIGLLYFNTLSLIQACDICGCSANSHTLGVMPLMRKHFFGLRYSYRSYYSQHPGLSGEVKETSREYYHSADLWARYVPHRRVQLFAFLPYNAYRQDKAGQTTLNTGFGDLTLLVNYTFFDNGDSLHLPLRHALQGGTGIKAPTGQWQRQTDVSGMNANLQLGSGSWDIPIHLLYTLRSRRWGFQTELSYQWNTSNKDHFRFGDRLAVAQQVFYARSVGRWSFMPALGMQYEWLQNNREQGAILDYSGGHLLSATASMQVLYKKFMLSASLRQPLYQGIADGNSYAFTRVSAAVVLFF